MCVWCVVLVICYVMSDEARAQKRQRDGLRQVYVVVCVGYMCVSYVEERPDGSYFIHENCPVWAKMRVLRPLFIPTRGYAIIYFL